MSDKAPELEAPDDPGDGTLVPEIPAGANLEAPDDPGDGTLVPELPAGANLEAPDDPGDGTLVPELPADATDGADVTATVLGADSYSLLLLSDSM